MKKIGLLLTMAIAFWSASAQTSEDGSKMQDIATHHRMNRHWGQKSADSAHQRDFRDFGRGREESMNRFRQNGRENNGSFDKFDRFGVKKSWVHLTPDQRRQSQAINKEFHQKSADLYKQDNITLKEYKSRFLALQKEKKSKLGNLLTTEQKDQVEMHKKHAEENAQVMAAARLERMKIRLKLTDEQATAIKIKQQNLRVQIRTIRENDNLMSYQKKEQIMSLAAKQKDELKSILTPEQVSQLDSMHRKMPDGK